MSRTKTGKLMRRCKKMRKCKIMDILRSPEVDLNEDEMRIFLLRLYKYNDGVSDEVGKCPRSVTTIFMNAFNKVKEYFDEKEGESDE